VHARVGGVTADRERCRQVTQKRTVCPILFPVGTTRVVAWTKQRRPAYGPGASQGSTRDAYYGFVTSKTRLSGEGPNDGQVTTPVWFTPGFDQSQTPLGKMLLRRTSSADVKLTV